MLQSQFYSPERIQPPQNPHFHHLTFQKKFATAYFHPTNSSPALQTSIYSQEIKGTGPLARLKKVIFSSANYVCMGVTINFRTVLIGVVVSLVDYKLII